MNYIPSGLMARFHVLDGHKALQVLILFIGYAENCDTISEYVDKFELAVSSVERLK